MANGHPVLIKDSVCITAWMLHTNSNYQGKDYTLISRRYIEPKKLHFVVFIVECSNNILQFKIDLFLQYNSLICKNNVVTQKKGKFQL